MFGLFGANGNNTEKQTQGQVWKELQETIQKSSLEAYEKVMKQREEIFDQQADKMLGKIIKEITSEFENSPFSKQVSVDLNSRFDFLIGNALRKSGVFTYQCPRGHPSIWPGEHFSPNEVEKIGKMLESAAERGDYSVRILSSQINFRVQTFYVHVDIRFVEEFRKNRLERQERQEHEKTLDEQQSL